ncbi:hypothetical protein BST61_g10640 [Cercospora zeina]
MEILSTLLAFLLLLGLSAARPYVDYVHSDRTSTSSTKCTKDLTKATLSSTKTKCSSTESLSKYKSITTPCTSSKSSAGGYHTKSSNASSEAGGYHPKSTTASPKGQYYGNQASSTTLTTSTSNAVYPDKSTTKTTESVSSTSSEMRTSESISASTTSFDGSTTTSSELTTSTTTSSQPTETTFATGPNGERIAFDVLRDASISGTTLQISTINNGLIPRQEDGNSSPESACASQCALRPLCEAWQLDTDEEEQQTCTLKGEIGETEDSEGSVVGIRVADDNTTTSTTSSASTTSMSTTVSTATSSTTTLESATTLSSCQPTPTAGSGKRGLAYNYAAVTDLFTTTTCPATSGTSKVTWAYNWYSAPQDPKLQESPRDLNPFVQFVPMLWSAHPDLTSVWLDNVAAAKEQGWTELLAFNEPDLCINGAGASCMSVSEAVTAYQRWISPLKDQGFRLGGPAVTSSETGKAWLRSFLEQCTGCNIDFIPIHWYGNPSQYGEFFSFLYEMYFGVLNQKYPIWYV